MRFVEEEHQLRLVRVAHFRHAFVEFGKQPQSSVEYNAGRLHQPVGGQDVDHAATVVGLQQVVDIEHRLADEFVATLLLQRKRPRWMAPIDAADTLP